MAANLDALKKLYTNIGGEEDVSGVTRIAVMIDKISEIVTFLIRLRPARRAVCG